MDIELKCLKKDFTLHSGQQIEVLQDINLKINSGDFLIILGKSGCGKTTLLNLISGHSLPDAGEVIINDSRVRQPHPSRVLLFQHPSLLPWLNVKENITFGCRIRKESHNLSQRAASYISLMGLRQVEKSYPSELSVGMAHRVALARALIGKPQLLLLDEPFRSLDTFNSIKLQHELISIFKERNFTVVFVTHNIEESLLLGNRIALLGGNPATIREIYLVDQEYPRNPANKDLLELKTLILNRLKEISEEND